MANQFPEIGYHPGYTGAFTRSEAEDAIPNGTTIVKSWSEPGDGTPNGTLGTVLGSIDGALYAPELVAKFGARFMYFIEWSTAPKVAVGVTDKKIARLS